MRRLGRLAIPWVAVLVLPALAVAAPLGATAGPVAQRAQSHLITRAAWLNGVELTQYWPVPEAWFRGQLVNAPGLTGLHPIDWLYSARGLSMQGSGISVNGQFVHIDALGLGGWVTAGGQAANFHGSPPFWRAGGYWKNARSAVTFPLQGGGWSNGKGRRYVPLPGVSFAAGPAKGLTYWESVAVDPSVIPMGSWIYIPAYRTGPGHGWFMAQDTGGAINGAHLDLYRPPPASPSDPGQTLWGQQIYVLPPGQAFARTASAATAVPHPPQVAAGPPPLPLSPPSPALPPSSHGFSGAAAARYELAGGAYPAQLGRGGSGGTSAPPG